MRILSAVAVGGIVLTVGACGGAGEGREDLGRVTVQTIAEPVPTCGPGRRPPANVFKGNWRARSIRIGDVVFLDLREAASLPAWRFAPARVHARHLRRADRRELLANGRDAYDALGIKFLVAPRAAVTISVKGAGSSVAVTPSPKRMFGGFRPGDGEESFLCKGDVEGAPVAGRPREARWTLFDASLIVAGARCASLVVARRGHPAERIVSFGTKGRCRR